MGKISKEIEQKLLNHEDIGERLKRILILENIERDDGFFPFSDFEGNFSQYINLADNNPVYISKESNGADLTNTMADIRVLMDLCSGHKYRALFIIATNDDLRSQNDSIHKSFEKMKKFLGKESRNLFELEIWDKNILLEKEKKLGIRID